MEIPSDSLLSRWKWPLATAVLLVLAVSFGYRWLNPAYERPVQPVPNGYDKLVELTELLGPVPSPGFNFADDQQVASVKYNKPFLDQAREALRTECVVALDWNADQKWFSTEYLPRTAKLKRLTRAFAAEALVATRQGDAQRAINSGLENLYLAKATARGGLGTDWLDGIATYTLGLMALRATCDTAGADDCKFVLRNLPAVRDQLEPPSAITEREWHFWRRINGVWTTFLSELTFNNNRKDFEKRMEQSLQMAEAKADLLRLHYAIRAFQIQENRLPKSLDELAGREFKAIPKDPYNDQDFIYQPGKDRYILYSVGPNGVDDGGFVNDKDSGLGDLVLEPFAPSDGDPSEN